ncbi:MAG: HNH endonuclease [Helicobacteraceae bacterium]|jgi:site-specific DNA-methyltransferase (adenine-specific)|nr:HNH endonuclease [Helicobacteraceae bacterium]
MEFTSALYTNDNLYILNGLNSNLVDLIYLDPPFNTKRFYSAPVGSKSAGASFKDMWTWADVNEAYLETLAGRYPSLTKFIVSVGGIHGKAMMAYLTYMAQRIIEMHRVLKDTGSLYLHCDPTASHYLKLLLDEIFGKNNFRNEIVWHYRRWTGKAKKFQSLHDIVLFYTKTDEYTFNEQYTPYTQKSLKRKQNYHTRIKGDDVFVTSIDEKGVRENDVWVDIQLLNSQSKERTGYPTQKPLSLLHRIIKFSSNEGDIVLDPFCGCATTCVAAQQLGRKWIGIDIAEQSVGILVERLSDDAGLFKDFINTTKIPQRTDIQIIEPTTSVKERLYKEQNGLCNGCKAQFEIWNMEIDHIIPKSKGGGDYYENYQLLCASCNKIKGARPMEYLRLKIKAREEMLGEKIIFGE